MALSRTDHGTGVTSGDEGSPVTVANVTVAAGGLLVAVLSGEGDEVPSSFDATQLSVSGGGLTWTRHLEAEALAIYNTGTSFVAIFTAPCPSGITNQTISGNTPTGVFCSIKTIFVCSYTGQHTSPVGGTVSGSREGTTGSWTLTLSAAPATTSEVIAGLFTYHDAGGNQTTAGTGWTALSDDNKYLTQVRGSSTSTDVLFDEAGSSQGGSAAVALEIKEAGSGGSGGTLMNIIIT